MEDTATGAGDRPDQLATEPGHLAELPRSLAAVTTAREGDLVAHQLLLAPGATAADVTAAMILLPPAAALVEHHANGEVTLVFQEPDRLPAGAAVWRVDAVIPVPSPQRDAGPSSGGTRPAP
jgi:uncharacterized repeat protein (TIGR03917 family)